MNSLETRLANLLKKRILQEMDDRIDGVIAGVPREYAEYREKVGYMRALKDVLAWLDEAQEKVDRHE